MPRAGASTCLPDNLTKRERQDTARIDRAVRAQKACERDHRGPAAETYERQV
jgi:hypothetical protein